MSLINDEAYAYFRVAGIDFEIEEITAFMGIAPTEAWRKGDPGRFNPSRPDSGWCLYSPLPRSEINLSEHLEALLPILEQRAPAVLKLGRSYRTYLVLVGSYLNAEPSFFLSADVIRRIAALGLSIDCDQYCRCHDDHL